MLSVEMPTAKPQNLALCGVFLFGIPEMPIDQLSGSEGFSWGRWLVGNLALMPLLGIVGSAALFMADARYVQSAELNSAVVQIQVGQSEQIIATLDTQLQIAHRKLDASTDQQSRNELADEIRVLEDAKAAAERQRQKLMR